MKPIYLDNAATTPVDPRVVQKMLGLLGPDAEFGNPASRSHLYGWLAEEAVENARRQIADLIHADPREIVFTSGATESNNLAIKGIAANYPQGHIIVNAIEHKAVLDPCHWLEQQGHAVTYVAPLANGQADIDTIINSIQPDTCLMSVMHANNETGVINDIQRLADICVEKNIVFHTDAAQTTGKLEINTQTLKADLISISAHKIYGPKGIGALYVRRRPGLNVEAQIHGGGHERGMRSGTLASHQIVGLGEACAIAAAEHEADNQRIAQLRDTLWQGISSQLDNIAINGAGTQRLPGHLNVAFGDVKGDILLSALTGLAVSTGSACNSANMKASYVLKAMGLNDDLAHASIRFSLGRFTTQEEVDKAIDEVVRVVKQLRG